MKDIDFDELDKAVNSLMASAPTIAPTNEDKPPVNHMVTVTSKPVAAPSSELTSLTSPGETVPVATQPQPQPAKPVSITPGPVARKSGRFMDMVHGSSDMKPRPTVPVPSREGLTIAPRSDAETDTPAQPGAGEPTKPVEFSSMPDPIDMPQSAPQPISSTPSSSAPVMSTPEPYESPFLSDAKIEKRPLNPTATGTEKLETEPVEPAPRLTGDEPPIIPQIPELNSDLIEIESTETAPAPELTQAVDSSAASAAVAEPEKPLGPSSIPQQYKATQSTGDQSHAAIYDASQYPEPVAHPAKKKSGWLWVLWVILLLGVGAGGAVLLYNLGIIP